MSPHLPLFPGPGARANAPEPEPPVQLCAFYVGATEYAVDIMRVEEILQAQRVTPVPDAPPWVEGVMNLRGALIPVLDLRRRLGAQGSPPGRLKPRWLVARIGRRRVALGVDGVSEVFRVRRSELKPLPPLGPDASGATGHPAVVGAAGPPDRIRLLLNIKALLGEDTRP